MQLNIFWGDFCTLSHLEAASLDAISMWDTIEHLEYSVRTVQKAFELLRPGGLLSLTTGDFGSISAKLQGRYWRHLHEPTHLIFFSAKSILRLFEQIGLEVLHIGYEPIYRSVGQIIHRIINYMYQDVEHRIDGRFGLDRVSHFIPRINLFNNLIVVGQKQI